MLFLTVLEQIAPIQKEDEEEEQQQESAETYLPIEKINGLKEQAVRKFVDAFKEINVVEGMSNKDLTMLLGLSL